MGISLYDYDNPRSLGNVLRRRRGRALARLIEACRARRGRVRIVDLGGTERYWTMLGPDLLAGSNATVTIVNLHPVQGSTDGTFTHVAGDACDLSRFADGSFDLVHSNSVIEHVGDWDKMEAFARETRRLGTSYYVQTPYFWFPIEPHFRVPFFHWMPESWRLRLFMNMHLGHSKRRCSTVGEAVRLCRSARLLDLAQMRYLFPDSAIGFEWIGPVPKSLVAIKEP